MAGTSELAFEFPGILGVIDISDIMHSFEHDKSSFISQFSQFLHSGKLRNPRKLLKYFNGPTTSVSNVLLSFGAFPIIFVFYSK